MVAVSPIAAASEALHVTVVGAVSVLCAPSIPSAVVKALRLIRASLILSAIPAAVAMLPVVVTLLPAAAILLPIVAVLLPSAVALGGATIVLEALRLGLSPVILLSHFVIWLATHRVVARGALRASIPGAALVRKTAVRAEPAVASLVRATSIPVIVPARMRRPVLMRVVAMVIVVLGKRNAGQAGGENGEKSVTHVIHIEATIDILQRKRSKIAESTLNLPT